MKIIAGLVTLFVGIITVCFGFEQSHWLLISLGVVVVYTGYRVLKSKSS